ncbi:DUF2946 family protein [Vibrio sp. ABG19]|uniref:DUF2946 family protein n=1 Tax=Vibrio sp. ABG19 TaxID=2817385 RepID=UPI00249E0760|nr:DUF2946 family protein [Vibrio sp. ABG19]WGY44769.1 hypothetical protein J0X00_03390 [Vibrio sp. ABG19]
MNLLCRFHRIMICTSALSWLLVTLMPVLNAHSGQQNIWQTFCVLAGGDVEMAHPSEGHTHPKHTKVHSQHGKPCPCAHFSNFHYAGLTTIQSVASRSLFTAERYAFTVRKQRFGLSIPRAPPFGHVS